MWFCWHTDCISNNASCIFCSDKYTLLVQIKCFHIKQGHPSDSSEIQLFITIPQNCNSIVMSWITEFMGEEKNIIMKTKKHQLLMHIFVKSYHPNSDYEILNNGNSYKLDNGNIKVFFSIIKYKYWNIVFDIFYSQPN